VRLPATDALARREQGFPRVGACLYHSRHEQRRPLPLTTIHDSHQHGLTGRQLKPGRVDAAPVMEAHELSLVCSTRDGPVQALADIGLTIAAGSFVSLIGPSGCGKTTLLRAIADLEQPTAGTLLVNGMSPAEARSARAYGYVFQAPALYPWRNVERNITLPLEIMGIPRAERRSRARHWLGVVGLEGSARKQPWQLSGGMQQRVSIARALSFDPALLLMDEPFGALDEITRDHLNDQLHQLWRRTRKTVVFVTHSIAEAVYLSTRIVVMSPRPGRILEVIDSPLPGERMLDMRESSGFQMLAHRVRQGLKAGHSYDD
jgi:NitT/TauT family transport system ATP-binding protein